MSSKNPVRGFIRCRIPNCGCVATVHAVGEHKLIESGEPPRNMRNLGRLYYQCPEHGFQQGKGESFQTFIKENMAERKEDLPAIEAENKPLDTGLKPAKTEGKPAQEQGEKPSNTRLKAAMPYLLAVGAMLALIFYVNSREKPNEKAA